MSILYSQCAYFLWCIVHTFVSSGATHMYICHVYVEDMDTRARSRVGNALRVFLHMTGCPRSPASSCDNKQGDLLK